MIIIIIPYNYLTIPGGETNLVDMLRQPSLHLLTQAPAQSYPSASFFLH